jgi:hypothetical protein
MDVSAMEGCRSPPQKLQVDGFRRFAERMVFAKGEPLSKSSRIEISATMNFEVWSSAVMQKPLAAPGARGLLYPPVRVHRLRAASNPAAPNF